MFCFSETCRICKSSKNSFTSTCNRQKEVRDLFFTMIPELKDSKLNHFFKNFCVYCVEQLKLFEKFKNHCIESDKCYMHYVNKLEGHAELVSELHIKQNNDESQIQSTLHNNGIQEASSYILASHCSNTADDIQIDIIKPEIFMPVIKEKNKEIDEAISIMDSEEPGSEESRNTLMLTNQETLATDYCRSVDDENVKLGDVELSNNGRIEDFNVKIFDKRMKIDDFSSNTEDDITEIDIVKHEVWITVKDESCNFFDSSVNNHESQGLAGKKSPLNHPCMIENNKNHTNKKLYECDICKKSFSCKQTLITHSRKHTGEKPYECDVCKKSFSDPSHLRRHKRNHTGEKPHECDVCKKRYTRKEYLIAHKRTHTGEKPYHCDVCNESFSIEANMKRHQRIHTGEKPFECDICKNSFSYQQTLKIHKRNHNH